MQSMNELMMFRLVNQEANMGHPTSITAYGAS